MITDDQRTFLNDLRASGAINMWGAIPFLQEHFDLERDEARLVLVRWMLEKDPTMSTDWLTAEQRRQLA